MEQLPRRAYHWLNSQREWLFRLRVICRRRSGLSEKGNEIPLLVSLTSYGERLKSIHLCLESLLSQSLKPDRILLWLAHDAAETNKYIPRLKERGVEIRRCDDIKSYKKIIFALREFPDSVIVTADDDCFYPTYWLERLYKAWLGDKSHVYCYRGHRMSVSTDGGLSIGPYREWDYESPGFTGPSPLLIPTGVGGVLYPPGSLNEEVFNEDVFMSICPTADDIWLKAMSLLNGLSCKKITPASPRFYSLAKSQQKALFRTNHHKKANDPQVAAVFTRYDIYSKLEAMLQQAGKDEEAVQS
jgi:hypothetical protein